MSRLHYSACAAAIGLVAIAILWWPKWRTAVPRSAASGTVTLGGRPLRDAVIRFVPIDVPSDVRSTGAEIVDGRYQIAEADGLVEGKYRVEILPYLAPDFSPAAHARAGPPRRPPQIPARYHRQSKLFASVTGAKHQRFDFVLQAGE